MLGQVSVDKVVQGLYASRYRRAVPISHTIFAQLLIITCVLVVFLGDSAVARPVSQPAAQNYSYRELILNNAVNFISESSFDGLGMILKYQEASPNRVINRYDIFKRSANGRSASLERLQMKDGQYDVQLADIESADCNVSLVKFLVINNSVNVVVSERCAMSNGVELAQADSIIRRIRIFIAKNGILPGNSSILFEKSGEQITQQMICTRQDVENDLGSFI